MVHKTMLGGIAVLIVLFTSASLTQAFAAGSVGNKPPASAVKASLEATSNPSASCDQLGLGSKSGTVTIAHGTVYIMLQHASPNGVYNARVGYKTKNGCDGTWHFLGLIHVDENGRGTLVSHSNFSASLQYIVEVNDSAGATHYATPFVSP